MLRPELQAPIQAAESVARAHRITPDRREVLQDGNTLVLRMTESVVARIVADREGPRQGTEWFAKESAIARHLSQHRAPIIPLHPSFPPEPQVAQGYTMSFWLYVTAVKEDPGSAEVGRTLYTCHRLLQDYPAPLPPLAIPRESLGLLASLAQQQLFPASTLELLRYHLETALRELADYPQQPLHGDAHPGNVMNTTQGLLWTDWEDAFAGPPEWDLASLLWNARYLENDQATVAEISAAYRAAGGQIDPVALEICYRARAAVMTAWYPILYPEPSPDRQRKLALRIAWLQGQRG
jgi:thiamine kinase-like enzyme